MKNRVQALRKEKNLTQTELAEKSKLSLRTIQRIEAGTISKGFSLRSIAETLETDPQNLFLNHESKLEINRAKLINISALSFLIIPFGNIIFPSILLSKTKDLTSRELGKITLSIQIVWTVLTCILLISSPFIQKILFIKTPLSIIILILSFCLNVFIILKNGYSLSQNSELSIKLKNSII